ncbi:L-rhamnose-binding lectin CSL3-like [Anneissia japonica]|uniref:L-rhamnose-binding lectin CSL3-like n=1 Tax=Anneissia japonica TaxID=1529436 RepID=UPI001425554D|nr:L-rhamnose-binding lectin CSL3-like [Anneissia japonica]
MAIKQLILFCCIAVTVYASSQYSVGKVTKCEGQQIDIRCGNQEINILYARYGSPSYGDCGASHYFPSNCEAANSLAVVRQKCQGKKNCWVKAHNDVFGDPCVGVRKSLTIHYTCVDYEIVGACEGKQIDIRCGSGKTINILYAIYGANFGSLCTNSFDPWNAACYARNSFQVTRNKCQGKQNCWVKAHNDVFNRVCRGRPQHALDVHYRCVRGQLAFACENKQVDIRCPSGTTINILSAFYGRNNQQGCRNPIQQTRFGLIIRSPCSATNALQVAKNACNGKHNCWIKARDNVFNIPCQNGPKKHLEVEFECRKH